MDVATGLDTSAFARVSTGESQGALLVQDGWPGNPAAKKVPEGVRRKGHGAKPRRSSAVATAIGAPGKVYVSKRILHLQQEIRHRYGTSCRAR